MENKKRLTPYIPLIITSLLGLVLFILVEDDIIEVIVQPLLRVTWFFTLIIKSLPQSVIWVVFIFVMLFLTYSSLKKVGKTESINWQTPPKNTGTVERWVQLLENTRLSNYSKWHLAQKLKMLTKDLLSPIDIDKKVRIDLSELDLPEEIRTYFEAQLLGRVPFWRRFKQQKETALDLDPEVVLNHLKDRLNL